jgi:lysophospholipase L1-like esterase
MILHGYGCSWTVGEGSDISVESTLKNQDLILFRNEHSWVNKLANKLQLQSKNNGISGNANNKIFNQIVVDIQDERIKKNDFVVIMWSSSLRDYVPFLPKGEWISWSVNHLLQTPQKFVESYKSSNTKYTDFLIHYKDFFIVNLYNEEYYNIVNQNYIIFIQKLLNHYGIKYAMCDAFEPMITNDTYKNLIDTNKYWNFGNKTFRDFLNDTNRLDIWEHTDTNFKTRATQHPNKDGYNLISEELYNYIVRNNII